MPSHRKTSIAVPLASTVVGGSFGLLAMAFYGFDRQVRVSIGAALGAAAGLAVGIAWVAWMRRMGGGARRAAVIGWGTLGGLLAGAIATAVLHAGVQLFYSTGNPLDAHMVGQMFGLPAGVVLGVIGGTAWNLGLAKPGAGSHGRP